MRGKQSSKISLKKRLLKRRQALTRRWDKQSTRRHLPLYLLPPLKKNKKPPPAGFSRRRCFSAHVRIEQKN